MTRKSISERIQKADTLMQRYMGDYNEAAESGRHQKAEKLFRKCQYWLDRYNLLTGNGEKKAPR